MSRAFLLVLDSVGIGGAPDAARFGDAGANTVGHIAARMALNLPHLASLGLGLAVEKASGCNPWRDADLRGCWGIAEEVSAGKDTITGHWEIAGVPLPFAWHYFPATVPAFPESLLKTAAEHSGVPGFLALKHASGIAVIDEHGAEHMRSGKPIMYTSTDSVIQIAAHEETFGLDRLYEVCRVVRGLTYDMRVGRVIARPFLGEPAGGFTRTGNRKDFAIAPPGTTLLDGLAAEGRAAVSIGKIGDIFAHRSTGREIKPHGNDAMFDATMEAMAELPDGGLVFVNFLDFDTLYGHRRDWHGYGRALEAFDRRLPEALGAMRTGDLLILTADHGNDPTWAGTDHTRECVPVLCHGPGLSPGFLGHRRSLADIGQTIARHLGVRPLAAGEAWSV